MLDWAYLFGLSSAIASAIAAYDEVRHRDNVWLALLWFAVFMLNVVVLSSRATVAA
jgi:hypothetical protein